MQEFDIFYSSNGICTDTRKISQNCLFICIKGDNFNGNTFASKALEEGALHVIVDDPEYFDSSKAMTLVDNSIEYLQNLANYHRKKFDIPVIGITGSNGKTTNKELINAVLSKKYNVLATEGNLNNHLGVPFTLLRLNETHDIAIIEMGANRFKDIEELCAIAEPTHGMITNIGKAHLEGFGGFEGVLKTKRELYEAVRAVNGTIFYNNDDEILENTLPEGSETYSFGTKHGHVTGELEGLTPFVKMNWSRNDYSSPTFETNMVGKYNFTNYLASAAIGAFFEVPQEQVTEALSKYTPSNNRSQVIRTDRNTLIMDCYNANPTSMRLALESFAMMEHDNKLAIMGDMKELGNESDPEHKNMLMLCEELDIRNITVGEEFGKQVSELRQAHFNTTDDLLEYLSSDPLDNHLLLLKGSRSIGLEKLENSL